MKRDMNLVRRILKRAAEEHGFYNPLAPADQEATEDEVRYHVGIMAEAGLLDADGNPYLGSVLVKGLTWAGQDFLAAIEDDTIWNNTKRAVKKAVGDTTLAVIKATAEGLARGALGLM